MQGANFAPTARRHGRRGLVAVASMAVSRHWHRGESDQLSAGSSGCEFELEFEFFSFLQRPLASTTWPAPSQATHLLPCRPYEEAQAVQPPLMARQAVQLAGLREGGAGRGGAGDELHGAVCGPAAAGGGPAAPGPGIGEICQPGSPLCAGTTLDRVPRGATRVGSARRALHFVLAHRAAAEVCTTAGAALRLLQQLACRGTCDREGRGGLRCTAGPGWP